MNKNLFFTLYFGMCFCLCSSAQTIHTIIFTDTQDSRIGIAAQASHDNYTLDFLSTIETAIGSEYNSAIPIERNGYDCDKSNLLEVINNLSCEENDIVIFIYLGHGARAYTDKSNFPQMCFALPRSAKYRNGNDYYPLENVRDLIMRKNPRFCLVIGDCCNSYSPFLSSKPSITGIEAMSTDIIRRQGEAAIKRLFLSKKGSVILTASVKGEYGWCTTKGDNLGMFLERCTNQVFQNIKDGKTSYNSWEDLLLAIKNKTYQLSCSANLVEEGKRYTQTPYYEIDLVDAPFIKNPKPKVEAKSLQQALSQVIDGRTYSDRERIAKSRELQSKYFEGDNAVVEVVGKDRKTVIQTTNIRKYLLRAATEEDLANITILDQKNDNNNKIVYLKIHEIYLEPVND